MNEKDTARDMGSRSFDVAAFYCRYGRGDSAGDIARAGKPRAELVGHKRHRIGEHAHIADRKRRPLPVVHFSFDRTHRGKAGSAEQVEDEEGEA